MNAQNCSEEVRAIRVDRERIAGLLEAYPRIDAGEAAEIVAYLKSARHLDIGLLSSDGRIRSKLDRFTEDHKAHFRLSVGEVVLVLAGMIGVLCLAWLVWEAFQ